MKFGTNVPSVVLFQKKVLATTKTQDGGFFSRWPPDRTLSHENHNKNGHTGPKIGMGVPKGLQFHTKTLAQTKNQDGGFFPRWQPHRTRFLGSA